MDRDKFLAIATRPNYRLYNIYCGGCDEIIRTQWVWNADDPIDLVEFKRCIRQSCDEYQGAEKEG